MPYWNPNAETLQIQHFQDLLIPVCQGTSPLNSGLSCSYSFDSNRLLTITSILSTQQTSGT